MHISPVLWQFLVKWLTNSALFPPEASAISPYMDAFYFFLIAISAVGMIAVIILVFGFSILYRKEKNPVATQIEGSTLLEATWTIIPLALFMICFVWGALLYFRIYDPPTNAMNIYIVGKQWMWKAEHPGGQHEIDSLHVPINRQVQLTMISQDVFHSFSIPAFRVKREVIPGRYSTVWFEATATGTYHLFCTQYCGTDHSAMIGEIVAMTPDDYQKWAVGQHQRSLAGAERRTSLCQPGLQLLPLRRGDRARTQPGPGLWLPSCSWPTDRTVTADDAFLRETILNPSTRVTAGYAPIMPTYQGQVSEEGLIDLVEYIKNLNSNYRVQQTLTASQLSSGQAGASSSGSGSPAMNYRSQQTLGRSRWARKGGQSGTQCARDGKPMSTIVTLPDQQTAQLPKLSYLNSEYGLKSWLLTGDHKRIAMLYLISITFFFFIGGAFAGLIRLELLTPLPDLVASDTYNKLFTMHGVIMIFLFLVPSVPATVGNFVIPIMVGAKDLAFPKINLLSWYLYVAGACFLVFALLNGGVDTGWTFTTPLSTHYLNTHVITAAMGVFIAGFSSIFTGLNFIVTIHRMRCPGMTWFRLPLFCWSHYAASHPDGSGHAGAGHHPGAGDARADRRHRRLRSHQGWRPAALPAPLLVLFPPRRLHHDSARHGSDLRGHQHLLAQAGLRLYRGGLLLGRHCRLWILCLGPSHVHHGRLQLFGAGLLAADHAGRGAFGDQDLQLGGDSL